MSPLDKPIHITTFPNLEAKDRESLFLSLREFADRLHNERAPTKQHLPLFSTCSFDSHRTTKGSLRHDGNVREAFAAVGDYDGGKTSPAEAADALRLAGIVALVVTTPSHTAARPRWRVIAPLHEPLHRNRNLADYQKLVSRLAGIFPENLAAESWVLSQSWYIGTIDGAPDHQVVAIEGDYIDQRPDLDANARPKPPPAPKTKPVRQPRRTPEPQDSDASDDPVQQLNVGDALAALTHGNGSHEALVSLSGKFASQGIPQGTAEAVLHHAIDQRAPGGRDPGWQRLRGDVHRTVAWAYEKFAQDEATMAALVASAPRPSGNGSAPPPPPPGAGPAGSPTPPPQPGTGAPPGRTVLRNRTPKNAGNVANVITFLLQTSTLAGCIAFDEMTLSTNLRQPLPGDTAFTSPRPWTDADTCRLQDFLQRECGMGRVSRETVGQGADFVGRLHPFHPVRLFLAATARDGTQRLDTWLTTYLGVADSEYARRTGRMWMIGMVARIMRPGCKFDHLLILEGAQGVLKSQVARALCAPWVSDTSLDIRHDARAASQHLRGVWLHELSELVFFRPADVEAIKGFLSRTHEKYLPRYAHNEVIEPRQVGFLGTTNRQVYLNDPTGGRRFWPHRVGTVAIRALMHDRTQLWAEALAAYQAGEHWWPEAEFEEQYIQPEQAARYDEDGWASLIGDYLAGKTQVTLIEVFRKAIADPHDPFHPELPPERFDRRAQLRVREVLENLGWRRGHRTPTARLWVAPP